MRYSVCYSLLALLLLVASPVLAREQAPEEKSAASKEVPDVQAALFDWKAAVESGSVTDIMKLYDKRAMMISTFAQDPMTKREEIAGYFKKVVGNPDIKIDIDDSYPRMFGTMAINSGRYTLNYTQDGEPITIPARFTFVYLLQGKKWMIVEQHSSRVPLPDESN